VAAVVDADLARARAVAARHAGAVSAVSLEDVAHPGRVVHICTPLEHHARHAAAALDAGCHVLVEKPLAESAASTASLLDRARDAGRLLVPVHQYLFQPGVERARRLLSELGPVLHADIVACTAGADARSPAGRTEVALQVLPHPLSLVERLVAPLSRVGWHVVHPQAGELRVTGVAGGASVAIVVSTRGRPTRHQMLLVCAGGTIRLDLFHGYAVVVRGASTRAFKVAHPFVDAVATLGAASANLARRVVAREPAYPGLRELVRRTYAAAAEGGRPPIDARETLAVASALDAIRGAASGGARQAAVDVSFAAAGPLR
jgi:predicted dehydrogenase